MTTICIAERSVCAIRAVRLGSDCAPLTGATDGAVSAALVTMNVTSDVQEGTKFEPTDGCGRLLYTAEDPDIIKRKNITLDLGMVDFEMIELLTDSTVILGATGGDYDGQVIGIAEPGPSTTQGYGIGLEVWTKTAFGTGACAADGSNPPYIRHVFPRVFLRPADRTFENAPANFSLAGTANANPQWGEGPWGDWPAEGDLEAGTPHARFFDTDIPEAVCGYITPGGS